MMLQALRGEAETLALGGWIAGMLAQGDVIALRGPLGAGKTTLARGILRGLGLDGEAPSPSYAIVQPYDPPQVRLPVTHVDLYRLDEEDADTRELGLEEARAEGVLLVEWPERLGDRLWRDSLVLDIAVTADGQRTLTATVPPSWEQRWSLR